MYVKLAPATWQCARARCKVHHRTRYLHLLDSQVNLAGCSKGRTGSRRLQHILSNTNAVLLATGMRDISGYVRSKKNPADKASRDKRAWHRHRRALARASKAVSPAADLAPSVEGRQAP